MNMCDTHRISRYGRYRVVQSRKSRKGLIEIKSLNIPLIISSHDFKETPADPVLLYRLNVMEHFGADIGKLAVTPNNGTRCFAVDGVD